MDYSKYIIVKEMGHNVPILFSHLISHDTFLQCYAKVNIKSAGFFRVEKDDTTTTFGKSLSLNLSSNSEDAILIEKLLLWRD